MTKVEANELEDYIRSTLASIKKGVHAEGGFRIHGMIEFDLAVTNVKEAKGGLRVYVVGAGAKHKSEKISKIRFRVKPYADQKIEINKKK